MQDPRSPLPYEPLRRLSDYMYLVYYQSCTEAGLDIVPCLRSLTWVIHEGVINKDSIAAANFAVGRPPGGRTFSKWPPAQINMVDESGAGLLAAPNGRSAAFLVGQHKGTYMGKKTVDYAYVFGGTYTSNLCLAYHLTPSPDLTGLHPGANE